MQRNHPAITALVKAGANPEDEALGLGSPLSVVLDQPDASALKALLAGGVDPDSNHTPDTPIIFKGDAAKLLIEHGARVDLLNHRRVSFAWVVQNRLDQLKDNPDQSARVQETQRFCEARGVTFPTDRPQVVRQRLGIPE